VVADAALQGARVLTWMEVYVSAGGGIRICEVEMAFCKLVAWALEVDTEGAAGRLEASQQQQHRRRAKGLAKQVRACASWHSTHTYMDAVRPTNSMQAQGSPSLDASMSVSLPELRHRGVHSHFSHNQPRAYTQ
jgi:hypothetical protein